MLLELYLFLEVVAIICFAIGFFNENVWFSSMAVVLSGVLMFASFNIEQNAITVANQTTAGAVISYEYKVITSPVKDLTYTYINLGVFGLSLIFFLTDLFFSWKNHKLGARKG